MQVRAVWTAGGPFHTTMRRLFILMPVLPPRLRSGHVGFDCGGATGYLLPHSAACGSSVPFTL